MEGSIAERTDGWRINDHAVCPDFSVKVRGSLGETAGHEIEIFRHGRVDLINETEERGGDRFVDLRSLHEQGPYGNLVLYSTSSHVYHMSELIYWT